LYTLESFKAVQALKDFEDTGKESTIRTAMETDGKTNGVAIMLAQFFGVATVDLPKFLKATGMFTDPSDVDYFTATAGEFDLYQDLAIDWSNNIDALRKDNSQLINAQSLYFGNLLTLNEDNKIEVTSEGRALSKDPLMTVIFGKGIDSLKLDIGQELVNKVYAKVQKLMDESSADSINFNNTYVTRELNAINSHIKLFTAAVNYGKGTAGTFTLENYKDHVLSKKITNAIIFSTFETYGDAVGQAIDFKFKPFYKIRSKMVNAMDMMGQLFIDLVEDYAKTNDLIVTNELIKELSEGKFKDYLPAVNTPNSKGDITKGFLFIKQISERSEAEGQAVQITFNSNRAIKGKEILMSGEKRDIKPSDSMAGNISQVKLIVGGVGGIIGQIHTIDGSTIQPILTEFPVFGVHDAKYANPLIATDSGMRFNEVFRDINSKFSITQQIENRLLEFDRLVVALPQSEHKAAYIVKRKKLDKTFNFIDDFGNEVDIISFNTAVSEVEASRLKYLDPNSPDVIKLWTNFISEGIAVPGIRTPTEDVVEPETGLTKEGEAAFEEVSILDSDVGQRALGRISKKAEKNPNLTEVVRGTGRDIRATDPELLDLLKSYSEQKLQELIKAFNCRNKQ
jgi:hypothetical protein